MTIANGIANGMLEQRTDGLWLHHGKLAVGPPGANASGGPRGVPGDMSVNRGNNQGAIYFGAQDNYLYFNGTAWVFQPALASSALAAGTAQAQIGYYMAPTTFSTTSTAAVLTPITSGSIACSGALCRVEFSSVFAHSAAGGYFFSGLSLDGTPQWNLSLVNCPAANYQMSVAWTVYVTVAAGNHTFTVHVTNGGGTLTMHNGLHSTLFVTEQRR